MDYGLIFVGWFIAVTMVLGIIYIQAIKSVVKRGLMDGFEGRMMELIVQEYDNANFSRRVGLVMYFGAITLSIIFFPFMYKNKK